MLFFTKVKHLGTLRMLRTIVIGSCVSVQGVFVRELANGLVEVRVGDRIFTGYPVAEMAA